jgi:hypothetical protein
MSAPDPDHARAGMTRLGSVVAIVLTFVLAAAMIRVVGWLPLLLIILMVIMPVWRLLCASRRLDAIFRESTPDRQTGPGAEQ